MPVVYFRALAPGQYWVVAPAFVTTDDPAARSVALDAGPPVQDMQPGGLVSPADLRAYATREARYRLHQQRFKLDVMRAYRHRCAICTLRERELVQARTSSPTPRPRASPRSSTGSRCARSTTSRSTATCSASTPRASCTSPAGCCARSTDRCRTGIQGFHGGRIACRDAPRTARTGTGSSCASSVLRGLSLSARRRSVSRGGHGRPGPSVLSRHDDHEVAGIEHDVERESDVACGTLHVLTRGKDHVDLGAS